jgi:hypothetical protein
MALAGLLAVSASPHISSASIASVARSDSPALSTPPTPNKNKGPEESSTVATAARMVICPTKQKISSCDICLHGSLQPGEQDKNRPMQ